MTAKTIQPLFYVVIFAGLFFLLHHFLLQQVAINTAKFQYTLAQLYIIFTTFSVLIITILVKIRQKNLDLVGMTFLVATSLKMMIAYLIIRPVLHQTTPISTIEKTNFFVIFILFLAIETLITIQMLNNKQKNNQY